MPVEAAKVEGEIVSQVGDITKMPTEWQLRQVAIETLHGMLRGNKPRKFSSARAEIALAVLQEMREAKEDRMPPEWVQQLAAETALENARDRKDRNRD